MTEEAKDFQLDKLAFREPLLLFFSDGMKPLTRLVSNMEEVTDLLNDVLSSPESAETAFACGPAPMLRAVARIVNDARVPCQLSLESFMACGIGACLGCVVRIRQGSDWSYARVCVEGPTLDAKEVVWD